MSRMPFVLDAERCGGGGKRAATALLYCACDGEAGTAVLKVEGQAAANAALVLCEDEQGAVA
jgi:hypothetical protein